MLEMRGAEARARHERALVWWGAMLPHMKKPPKFDEFVGRRRDLAACLAAWDKVDRALEANMRRRG